MIRAVYKFQGLLRAVVATAGNDHGLGANEAPPAIISIFFGDQLSDVFEQIKKGGANSSLSKGMLNVGVDVLPPLPKDAGDRNRTSPFAFTGNRFEFRAVGLQSVDCRPPRGDEHDHCRVARLLRDANWKQATGGDASKLNDAIQSLLTEIITECESIIFNGDGYSEAWHNEAAARGLLNMKTSVEALPYLVTPEVKALFTKYNVLSERELESRLEIYLHQYCLTTMTEARLAIEMAKTLIFPAAIRYQNELATTCANLKLVGYEFDTDTLDKITELVKSLQDSIGVLKKVTVASRRRERCWKKPATAAKRSCRRSPWSVSTPTSWKAGWPTISGRCRRTRKCCSSR